VAQSGKGVCLTRGSTFDNKEHLPARVLQQLKKRYEGTRLGRQELNAELLDDMEGALWLRDQIDACRVKAAPEMARIIVAIDPAMSSGAKSDETGIVAAGRGLDGNIYILADWSCRASPEAWARKAIRLYEEVEAQMIVGEVNAGGDLVERILKQIMPTIFFKPVRALRSKMDRALPVAALYEQGRVKHVGSLPKLEDQMTKFTPAENKAKSPDRVDAMVWAVTALSETGRGEPRIRSI
ncbi:MAG: ATP-binding protein, partial [Alphaproteobacteria bacterium]|nr:ATP-binding protein [Alphaproteobacteria bacterium]